MIIYTVKTVDDRFNVEENLMDTTDKQLAYKVLGIVRELYSTDENVNTQAILCMTNSECEVPDDYIWWYDDAFTNEFINKVWSMLKEK